MLTQVCHGNTQPLKGLIYIDSGLQFFGEKNKSEREKGGAKIGDRERERRLLQPSSHCATVKVVTKSLASGVLELCASGLTQISDNRAGRENFSPGGGWFMKIPWRNSLNFMDIFILN